MPTIRYRLLNVIVTKVDDEEKQSTLNIVSANNNDHTSTFTQSDHKKLIYEANHYQENSAKLFYYRRTF